MSEQEQRDAYWGKSDPFEHDVMELFGHFISPEEFIKKWKPKIAEFTNNRGQK